MSNDPYMTHAAVSVVPPMTRSSRKSNFNRFDRDSDFWKKFISENTFDAFNEKLEQQVQNMDRIEGNQVKGQRGNTLVIFIDDKNARDMIKDRYQVLEEKLDEYYEKQGWYKYDPPKFRLRESDDAWHITVFATGLEAQFGCVDEAQVLETVKPLIEKHETFFITMQGFGLMGFGGLAGRMSQPTELDGIQNDLEKFCRECSKQKYFDPSDGRSHEWVANKIMLGQLLPELDKRGQEALEKVLGDTEYHNELPPITLYVDKISFVQYDNVFLDKVRKITPIYLS